MSELRDFLNWFDGFADNIEKTPTPKQWAKIKERVAGLNGNTGPAKPASPPVTAAPPAPKKPDIAYPFIIDKDGYVRRGSGKKDRVLPSDVNDIVCDMRGINGDISDIVWADDRTGLLGADLTITVPS